VTDAEKREHYAARVSSLTAPQLRLLGTLMDWFLAEDGLFGKDLSAALSGHLEGHGFERSGCLPMATEVPLAARARGQAADAALDAVIMLRHGDLSAADDLLYAALKYLSAWKREPS
jgi:hypothetical protein